MKIKKHKINHVVLAAMLLSIGFVLPIFISQIKEIGDTLLPMHIPVMLCGIAGGFIDAMPGIILQLVLIPSIMAILNKRRMRK